MKTGVTSANFKFSGTSLFHLAQWKSNCKVFAVTSALGRSIFGGILSCVVALFGFKPFIYFLMPDSFTCLKRKLLVVKLMFYNNLFNCIVNVFVFVINNKWISFNFMLETAFSKKLFNAYATFSSFGMISSLSVSFILVL